ncbi:MAG: NADH-quinone oxidoreductase subunit A [Candidatus Micrarchaeota archaeon]|nr:NADH-quinone oxidoreductase subunit A [Candidatus Micrarchaeota archaeon]
MVASYTYVALAIFAALALFVPISMLILAKLIGARPSQNPIKLENYESAETPIGLSRDITNDYLEYFPLYLGFETVIVIVLSWAAVSGTVPMAISLGILGISAVSFILSALALGVARTGESGVVYGR